MKTKYISILLALPLFGCASNIKRIGTIGDVTYYKIHCRSADGPNSTSLMALRKGESEPFPVSNVGGPGIGAAIIGAGGTVGAATLFGGAIRPSTSTSTTSVSNGSTSTSHAAAAAAATGGGVVNHNSVPSHAEAPECKPEHDHKHN